MSSSASSLPPPPMLMGPSTVAQGQETPETIKGPAFQLRQLQLSAEPTRLQARSCPVNPLWAGNIRRLHIEHRRRRVDLAK